MAQAPITYCLQFGSTRHALSALCPPFSGVRQGRRADMQNNPLHSRCASRPRARHNYCAAHPLWGLRFFGISKSR